jgi:hypothetical protein
MASHPSRSNSSRSRLGGKPLHPLSLSCLNINVISLTLSGVVMRGEGGLDAMETTEDVVAS